MDTLPDCPEPDDALYDLVERYVGGEMDEAESAAFDQRVRTDEQLRRILVETLALGSMVDAAVAGKGPAAATTPPRPARRRRVLSGLLATVALIAAMFVLNDAACREEGRPRPPADRSWPQAPLGAESAGALTLRLARALPTDDFAAGSAILDEFLPPGEAAIDLLIKHPVIRSTLEIMKVANQPRDELREIIALLLLLHDDRLSEAQRFCAARPLQFLVGKEANPVLIERALAATDGNVLNNYAGLLLFSLQRGDLQLIRALMERASHVGSESCIQTLLLSTTTSPSRETADLCVDVMSGSFGQFEHRLHVEAARYALVSAAELEDRDLRDAICTLARDLGAARWQRVYAASALLAVEKAEEWRMLLRSLSSVDDAPGRFASKVLSENG